MEVSIQILDDSDVYCVRDNHIEHSLKNLAGFMTFAPEWLTGSPNLDTSNFMYFWVYLIFFNTLWVWFPLWILLEAYQNINKAFVQKSDEPKCKKIL